MAERPADHKPSVLTVTPSITGGGAERVAVDLHLGYLAHGHEAWIAAANINGTVPNTLRIDTDANRADWARAILPAAWRLADAHGPLASSLSRAIRVAAEPDRYAAVARGHEDLDFPWTRDLLSLPPAAPDVLHLHNLHGGYFDIRALPEITSRVTTVMTLHDVWSITGHCAWPMECERWRDGCGECPDLDRYVPIRADATAQNRSVKHKAFASSSLSIATPSRWLQRIAIESGMFDSSADIRVIPNGIDLNVFAPGDASRARRRLGLPEDRRLILVAAKSLSTSDYKGFNELVETMRFIASSAEGSRVTLVTLGDEATPGDIGGIPTISAGFIPDRETVAEYFRAADIYVHPSRAESFGLTVAEAMATGIPVIANRVGALPDTLGPDSGLLIDTNEPKDFGEALLSLIRDAELRDRMGRAGVERATSLYGLEKQICAYLAWFDELRERRS